MEGEREKRRRRMRNAVEIRSAQRARAAILLFIIVPTTTVVKIIRLVGRAAVQQWYYCLLSLRCQCRQQVEPNRTCGRGRRMIMTIKLTAIHDGILL